MCRPVPGRCGQETNPVPLPVSHDDDSLNYAGVAVRNRLSAHHRPMRSPRDLLTGLRLCALLLIVIMAAACSDDVEQIQPTDTGVEAAPDSGDIDTGTDVADPPTDAAIPEPTEDVERPPTDATQEWEWDDEEFGIHAVSPASGPVEGGTRIHVSGTALSENTQLLIGAESVDVALSQGELVAETPPAAGPGPVTVRAISTGGETVEIPNGFRYVNDIDVQSIVPDRLPTTGGVEITLHGTGFMEPMGVSFSGVPARRVEVVSEAMARVVVPPMGRGYADVRVSVPDAQVLLEDGLYFFSRIDVDAIEPAIGDLEGGESVTLHGVGFTPDAAVLFGGQSAPVESVDIANGELHVLTPGADMPGPVDVEVINEFDSRRIVDGFVYDDGDGDMLSSIRPDVAPITGGTEHVVSGRQLDASDTVIEIGGKSAEIIDTSGAHARIEAPAADTPGTVDIRVLQNGVELERLEDAFEYLSELSIDTAEPDAGAAEGGETITIDGTGLGAVKTVSFGGLPASFEIIDDSTLSVTTPTSQPGSVDIIATTAEREAILEDGFYFEGQVQVWSMQPSRGAIAGDTFVTLYGQGFDGTIEIDIGDQSGTDIRRIDPYTVTFRTPSVDATGPREVTLGAMGQQASPSYPFVYFNPLSSFGGAHGSPVDGAINVSVLNMDGSPVPGAFVMLSTKPDTPYQGMTNANGQVTISGPDLVGPQSITATAHGLSTFTVRELNAENLTILLNPLEPAEGGGGEITPPPIAYFEGEITISGKGSDPDGGIEYNMSQVRTTRSAITSGQTNPGSGSIVDGEGSYEIRSRVGDLALVALCGQYDSETEQFTPHMMGVQRNLSASNGLTQEVDLDCDIPLEGTLPVKINDPVFAPDGPTFNRISTFLDFGYEGVFAMPNTTTGLDDILLGAPLPAPTGALAGITYSVVAGSYNDTGLPYTQTSIRDIEELEKLSASRPLVGVPELTAPSPGTAVDGEIRFRLKGLNEPDFYYLVLRNAMGLPVWTFVVPGDDDLIPMPEFPSFSNLPADQRPQPYQPGTLYSIAYALQIDGFNYDAFTYGDFNSGRWSSFAVDSWDIRLAD